MCTRCAQRPSWLGWLTVRSTDWSHPTLGLGRSTGRSTVSFGPVDWAVDRPESNCSLDLARSTGRSTAGLNGQKFDRWPVGRPVDRKAILGLVSCQLADLNWAYKYPNVWPVLKRFLREKNFILLKCFQQKVFGFKFLFSNCFLKCLLFQRK